MSILLFHPELIDYPGFWVLAILFLVAIGLVLFVLTKLIRKLFGRKNH